MRACLASLAFFAAASSAVAGNWPQWRGVRNDGHSPETNLPAEWDATKNVLFKVPMPGPGASTPCVWGDRIFLTAQVGENLDLLCVSTAGKTLWTRTLGRGEAKFRGDEGNMASASCSTDGKLVFAFVGSGNLAAYDFDGKPAWEVDCQKEFGKFRIQFGGHWTPVLHKDRLYVCLMHQDKQLVVAFEKRTGKVAGGSLFDRNRFREIPGLSREIQEKLERVQPETLDQALRIPGVTPAAVAILDVYLTARSCA